MVAYSFQPRFIDPILSGRKGSTIRAVGRRRHAVAGNMLQLYTGMRTRACRLIAKAPCIASDRIRIILSDTDPMVLIGSAQWQGGVQYRDLLGLNLFATLDGFDSWADMTAFWRTHHPGIERFDGVHIRWGKLTERGDLAP